MLLSVFENLRIGDLQFTTVVHLSFCVDFLDATTGGQKDLLFFTIWIISDQFDGCGEELTSVFSSCDKIEYRLE